MARRNGTSRSALDGLTIDLLRLCELDRVPDTLVPPERGSSFPAGIQRVLANFLSLLGWNAAAEWFVPTPDTRPFRVHDYLVRIPAAPVPNTPSEFVITLQAAANQSILFKRFEADALNLTAEMFGDIFVALGDSTADLRPSRLEGTLGLQVERGRVVLIENEIRADGGVFEIRLRNFDTLSEAKFTVDLEGWVIQR